MTFKCSLIKKLNFKGFDPYAYIDVESIEDERKKYTKEMNSPDKVKRSFSSKYSAIESNENQPVRLNFPDKRTVCNLYLKVDPTFYTEIYNNEGNQVKKY